MTTAAWWWPVPAPLVIGRGIGENFIASDQMALLPVTRRFIFLEEGDVAEVTRRDVHIFDTHGEAVVREELESELSHDAGDKGRIPPLHAQRDLTSSPRPSPTPWKAVWAAITWWSSRSATAPAPSSTRSSTSRSSLRHLLQLRHGGPLLV